VKKEKYPIIENYFLNKKLLFVTHNLNHEGAPYSLYYIAKGLKELGNQVKILSPLEGPLKEKYTKEKIDVLIEPIFWSEPHKAIKFFKEYDLIYLNTIVNFPLIETIEKSQTPMIWCIRESERRYLEEGLSKNHFKIPKYVVFVADASKKVYSDLEYNSNFVTIPNGIDIQEIQNFRLKNDKIELRRKYGFTENDIIITIVGTVIKRKGQLEFTEAAVRLLKSDGSRLKFLIVGSLEKRNIPKIKLHKKPHMFTKIKRIIKDPSLLKEISKNDVSYEVKIRRIITKNNCEANIHLIPETGKVFDYYSISDIFVCASYIESFPRVTLEAMAFELPIIATNVFGIPEQIENMRDGILLPPGDSDLLADKIQYLLKNPEERKKFANNAYEKVQKKFTIQRMINSYIDLIQKILD